MQFLSGAHKRGWWWAALLVLLPWAATAQVAPDWTVSNPGAVATMIALDADNNAYAAGSAAGSTMLLSKLGPSGTPLWQRSFAGGGQLSKSTWVTVDAGGNAIVTGMLVDASGTALGPVVLKYDPAGTLLWQDATLSTYGHAWRAATDAAGNVYVLTRQALPNGGGAVLMDMALTKYNPAGQRQWTRSYGARFTSAEPMVLTPGGNIIVTGTGDLPGQALLAAFDAAGNPVWSKSVATSEGLNLAVGRAGEFYAVGAGDPGFLVIKHDAAFNELWRHSYPARGSAQRAAVDSLGNLVVNGAVDTNTGLLQVVLYDWMTMKLDANGAQLWLQTYGQPGFADDVPASMALGADDAVYITGRGNVATVAANGITSYASSTATLKLASNGSAAWLASTTASTRGLGLRLGSDGGVFVVGDTPQTVYRYPQTGLPNQPPTALASASTSAGPAPLAVNFSSAGSTDPDGRIAGYAWDFGDGQGSNAANPSHTYPAGSYMVRLAVTDNLGATSASAPVAITANPSPLPPAQPSALGFASSSVAGGSSTTATVTVSNAAGVTVALASSNAGVAGVPATVVVPAGATQASFTVTTSKVKKTTGVTVRATANGSSVAASLTVRPK